MDPNRHSGRFARRASLSALFTFETSCHGSGNSRLHGPWGMSLEMMVQKSPCGGILVSGAI